MSFKLKHNHNPHPPWRQFHGLRKHPLYTTWQHMKSRCYNKKGIPYKNYGERGIKVCDEWIHNFLAFYDWAILNGWTKKLEIDRINNDGHYEPSNCRFTTASVNMSNQTKRCTNTSGYSGINFRSDQKRTKPWRATLYINWKQIFIGCFETAFQAAKAREEYIITNNLPHRLNFTGAS